MSAESPSTERHFILNENDGRPDVIHAEFLTERCNTDDAIDKHRVNLAEARTAATSGAKLCEWCHPDLTEE